MRSVAAMGVSVRPCFGSFARRWKKAGPTAFDCAAMESRISSVVFAMALLTGISLSFGFHAGELRRAGIDVQRPLQQLRELVGSAGRDDEAEFRERAGD